MKKYFLSIFLIIFIFHQFAYARTVRDFYRSNANGLSLIKIRENQKKDFKYILQVDASGDLPITKILFKENLEIKRWQNSYISKVISEEKYYKDKEIKEENRFDGFGHKIKETDYLNGKVFKITLYSYNKDGLVEKEEILNALNNQTTIVKYRYDKDFRIKQIEKKYPDNRIVYWESFFSSKGIIIKEYYALKDEIFTFLYSTNGQELEGEVRGKLVDGKEKVKIKWYDFYTANGKKERKEEENFLIGKRTKFWYNQKGKETKIETYYNDKIFSIDTYKYNDNDKVSYYKGIQNLNLTEVFYKYDKDSNLIESKHFQDGELKRDVE